MSDVKRVAIYTRVSTQEQSQEGYSLGEQEERLRMYSKAHGWAIYRVYTDPGYSGAKLDRPAIQELVRDCGSGAFDAVLIYKLDRLSRSQKDTLHLIEDVFTPAGVGLISMRENFDTKSAFGRAMIGVLSVFAQLERDQIAERTYMGREARAKEGYYSGGSLAPIGYDYVPGDNVLRINDDEAAQVRLIYDLYLHGLDGKELTYTAIRNYMRARYHTRYGSYTSTSTVSRILRDPVYAGMISWSGSYYPGKHEAIIDRETWDAVQAKIKRSSTNCAENFKGAHLLTGIVRCGICGKAYQIHHSRVHRRMPDGSMRLGAVSIRYVCASRRSGACSNIAYKADQLEEAVIAEVRRLRLDPDLVYRVSAPAHDDRRRMSTLKRIEAIHSQQSRLIDLYQIGSVDVDEVRKRSDALREEEAALQRDLADAEVRPAALDPDDAVRILSSFDEVFASGSLDDKRALIKSLVEYVEVFPDHIAIHWLFAAK